MAKILSWTSWGDEEVRYARCTCAKRNDQKPEKELIFEKFLSDIRKRGTHGAP